MGRLLSPLPWAVALTCTFALTGHAFAQDLPEGRPLPPPSDLRWELAARASVLSAPVNGGSSPFGTGFGGRLGVMIADVYVGASVVDYLGSTDVDVWSHGVLYGGEVGYGFRSNPHAGVTFIVRPQLGAGGVTLFRTQPTATSTTTTSTTGNGVRTRTAVDVISTASGGTSSGGSTSSGTGASPTTSTSVSNVYLQPGLTLLVRSDALFAGVNLDMLIVPGLQVGDSTTTWLSYGLEGQLGVRF